MSLRPALRDRLGQLHSYVRLAKLDVYQHWHGLPISWSLLEPEVRTQPTTIALYVLLLVSAMGVVAAAVTLDDVTGLQDGTDARNYQAGPDGRSLARKPLLLGEITPQAATWFAFGVGMVGVVAGLAAFVVAPQRPLWLLMVFVLTVVTSVQYSAGLRLSYLGGGEIVLAVASAVTVLLPYGLVTGTLSPAVAVQGVLVGLWMLGVSACSNTVDAEGDGKAGRKTMAVRLDPSANARFVALLVTAGWVLTLVACAAGWLTPWLLVGLAPAWVVQARQLRHGLGDGAWLRARRLGLTAFDLAAAGVVVVNLAT